MTNKKGAAYSLTPLRQPLLQSHRCARAPGFEAFQPQKGLDPNEQRNVGT